MKLRVAIDVVAAFPGLAVGLQAIAHAAQQAADDRRADPVPFLRQLLREGTQAAGRPQQRPHRIAPRHRLDQALQIGLQRCILERLPLAPAAAPADAAGRRRDLAPNVEQPAIDRRACQPADPRHQADPTASQRLRLQRDKAPAALLIQDSSHLPIALPGGPRRVA